MSEQRVIKVEPIPEDQFFYQKGDLVIGKCINAGPWPGIVRSFKGYDEDEVQVYTIDFVGTKDYAHLQTYLISPYNPHQVSKLKAKTQKNHHLSKAMSIADKIFAQIEEKSRYSPLAQVRFRKLYNSQVDLKKQNYEDVDNRYEIQNNVQNKNKWRGLSIRRVFDLQAEFVSKSYTTMVTTLMLNSTISTLFHKKIETDPVWVDNVTISIRDWGVQKCPKHIKPKRPMTRKQHKLKRSNKSDQSIHFTLNRADNFAF